MQYRKMKKTIVWFLVCVITVFAWRSVATFSTENESRLHSVHGYHFPYETMQPMDFNWNWDVVDLDASCPLPKDRYSFHQYAKAEVSEGYLYMAKGSGIPSQLLCIHLSTGNIVWEYSTKLLWNPHNPFVCLDHEIIVNYQTAIIILDKKTGKMKKECNIGDDKENRYTAFFSYQDMLLVEDLSHSPSVVRCIQCFSQIEIWSFQSKMNSPYRIVDVLDTSLLLIEMHPKYLSCAFGEYPTSPPSTSATLCSVSLETGERSDVFTWKSVCRIDYCKSPYGIDIGVLNSQGEGSIYSYHNMENPHCKVEVVLEKTPFLSKEFCKDVMPTLAVEDDMLGYRMFRKGKNYYIAIHESIPADVSSDTVQPRNNTVCTKLYVHKIDENGDCIWNKEFSSLENTNSIVTDAFIQEDFLVFQGPFRNPFSYDYTYAFWVDLETGNKAQSFYHFYPYRTVGFAECYPVFLRGVVLQVSSLNKEYLVSVQGFSCSSHLFFRNQEINVETNEVVLERMHLVEPAESYSTIQTTPVLFGDWIYFFRTEVDYQNEELKIDLYRYDVVKQKALSVQSFIYQDCENSMDMLFLLTDSLVLGAIDSHDQQTIVCFDIVEGDVIWEKKALFVDWIESNILYRNSDITENWSPPPDAEFTLLDPIENEVIRTLTFSTSDVRYIGSSKNDIAFFQRDDIYVSCFNLMSAKLEDEIVFLDHELYMLHLMDPYLLFVSDQNIAGCIDVRKKKLLWKKDMGSVIADFYEKYISDIIWKVRLIADNEALIYNNEGCNVIDMRNGNFLREYASPHLHIRSICETDSYNPLFTIHSDYKSTTCLQLNLDPKTTSEILRFPDSEYDESTNNNVQVKELTVQGQKYFIQYKVSNHCYAYICKHPSPQETILNASFIDVGMDISNYLYYTPYLIFQTSIGPNNRDFYLVAFHTENGMITTIHKGYHERVYIDDDQLYFYQYGEVFTCPIGEFESIRTTQPEEKLPLFESTDSIPLVKNYQEGVPPEYSLLDLYYINKIDVGYFTQTETEDMVFITGDDVSVKIGVMGKNGSLVVPIVTGSFELESVNKYESGGCSFYQSIFFDIDADGLEELILLTEYYVFVCDYFQKNDAIEIYDMLYYPSFGQCKKRELILFEGSLYIQHYLERHDGETNRIQYYIDYAPASNTLYSLQKCSLNLHSTLYQHHYDSNLAPFQFLEKPVQNGEMYVNMAKTNCKRYPETTMPPMMEPNDQELNEKELGYCQLRNDYLQKFLSYLDEGNDPFTGIQFQRFFYPDITSIWRLTLSPEHENDLLITHIYSFDVVQQTDGKCYFLLRIADESDGRYLVVLTENWSLLSYRKHSHLWDISDKASIIVSSDHPDYFWIQTYTEYEQPLLFLFGRISENNMKWVARMNAFGTIQKDDKTYFTIHNSGATGWHWEIGQDSRIIHDLQYRDPFSGASVNSLFIREILEYMEAYYSLFLMKKARWLSYGNNGSFTVNYTVDVPGHRRKVICMDTYVKTLLKLEYFLSTLGSRYLAIFV
jgi:outer membrane protein assembly factor BamB